MTNTVEQIENDVRSALAADVYATYDDTVVVVDYQAIVSVMDDDGSIGYRFVSSGNQGNIAMLGPARWHVLTLEAALVDESRSE